MLNHSPHSPTGRKLRSLLSPCIFVPCPDPVSREHPVNTSLLQPRVPEVPAGEGADALARAEAGHRARRAAEPSPAPGEEALAKRNISKRLARLFFLPTWCKKTARASAGMSWALGKLWTLAGTRWLVLNTFTGEGRLKEQNQRAKQTSHCRLPVQRT